MVNFILIAHGGFASGLMSAAELIVGRQENVLTFSLDEGDSIDELEQNVDKGIQAMSSIGEVLVFVDLIGASPFNISARMIQKYPDIKIVTGMNLPMLIDGLMSRDEMQVGELATSIVQTGRESCTTLDELLEGDS